MAVTDQLHNDLWAQKLKYMAQNAIDFTPLICECCFCILLSDYISYLKKLMTYLKMNKVSTAA